MRSWLRLKPSSPRRERRVEKSRHFEKHYLSQVMYLLVAAFVGFVAEFIVGWRLPFGITGQPLACRVKMLL